MSVNQSVRPGDIIGIFSRAFYEGMFCVLNRISPHPGILMSTQIYYFQYKKKKITLNYPKSAAMGFLLGTQEQVRNSHFK